MDGEILERARRFLRGQNLAGALLADPWAIAWLTGYAAPAETGPSPFDAPALAWLDHEGLVLILSENEAAAAESTGAELRSYAGYSIEDPLQPLALAQATVLELLGERAPRQGRFGWEASSLPLALAQAAEVQARSWLSIDGWTRGLRAVKTAGELAKIRAALRLCDLAIATLGAELRPGQREDELFNLLRSRIEQEAGGRVPLLADFVAGARTADIGGPPSNYQIQEGDPLLADIVPRRDGYWGDICNVRCAGEPSAELRAIYAAARVALEAAIAAVRPGVLACEVDSAARAALHRQGYEGYPHHTGHGIGVAYHEEPRIVAYNQTRLEPGMVIALEPGIYLPGRVGVRLEDVVLVTENGCEVLTTHAKEL